jgi:hypothetical protein
MREFTFGPENSQRDPDSNCLDSAQSWISSSLGKPQLATEP